MFPDASQLLTLTFSGQNVLSASAKMPSDLHQIGQSLHLSYVLRQSDSSGSLAWYVSSIPSCPPEYPACHTLFSDRPMVCFLCKIPTLPSAGFLSLSALRLHMFSVPYFPWLSLRSFYTGMNRSVHPAPCSALAYNNVLLSGLQFP